MRSIIAKRLLLGAVVALLLAGGAFAYRHHVLSRELLKQNNDAWAWLY